MTSSRVRCMKASDQKCKSVINQSFGRIVPMSIMILDPPPTSYITLLTITSYQLKHVFRETCTVNTTLSTLPFLEGYLFITYLNL